jgi:DNA-binding transcriptional LysR family regulator
VAFLTISILEEGSMDRIDAIKVLLTAQDEGSLAAADRKVGQSPATVSRAMAYRCRSATASLGTRASKLSDVGTRYANICRRLLTALDEAGSPVTSRSRRRLPRWR